jgi:hypothetical protein
MVQKNSFTAEHCRRITWAILDDGPAHFDDIKTTLDFKGPDKPVFPQSFLIDILRNVPSQFNVLTSLMNGNERYELPWMTRGEAPQAVVPESYGEENAPPPRGWVRGLSPHSGTLEQLQGTAAEEDTPNMGQANRGDGSHPIKEGDTREGNIRPETFPRADNFTRAGSQSPAIGRWDGTVNVTQN